MSNLTIQGNTAGGQNGYVKTKNRCGDVTGAGVSEIGIVTYAFLDSGSNTTFCTRDLMAQLGIEGEETILSSTTLQTQDRLINSQVVSLEVYDLDEDNLVELPTVFSTSTLPVNKSTILAKIIVDSARAYKFTRIVS